MKRYTALVCVVLLLVGLAALAKSPLHHTKSSPNFPMAYYTMNNNTLAHSMLAMMFESSDLYPECRWQPFSTVNSLLYQGDLWIGKSSSPQNIVCSPEGWPSIQGWINSNGPNGLYRPGDTGWPVGEPVLSEHDTYAIYGDHSRIGVEVKRHTAMWNNPLDADYFITKFYVHNVSGSTLTSLWFGRFFDFDLVGMGSSYMDNVIGSDQSDYTVWIRDRLSSPQCWVGTRGLNFNLSGMNRWDIWSDPGDISAFLALLTNPSWMTVSTANDWRSLAIYGPFSLGPGETREFSLATAFGSSEADMDANLNRAGDRYDNPDLVVETSTLGLIRSMYH